MSRRMECGQYLGVVENYPRFTLQKLLNVCLNILDDILIIR